MSENQKCLTFIWKIRNFNFFSKQINSPVFFAHVLDGTKWSLSLCPDNVEFPGCMACYIRRGDDDSATGLFQLDYELSLLSSNGLVLHSGIFLNKLFRTFNTHWETAMHVKKDEVLLHKKNLFMPDDTLTVRCRMWNSKNSISHSESCFAETSIKTECKSFVGKIKKFYDLEPWKIYPISISPKEDFLYSMSFCIVTDDKLDIEMVVSKSIFRPYMYTFFIRDIFGNRVKHGQGEYRGSELSFCFPLTLSKEHLTGMETYYFPKKILTIECEFIFSTGEIMEKNEIEYGFDFQDAQECKFNALKTNVSSNEFQFEGFTTLKDDLHSFFMDDHPCDIELKTATETFPAHISVLSARSQVFKAIFTNDGKKKVHKFVFIKDLDANTVRQMRKFIYFDTLDNLDYENIKNLYFAANIFKLVSLRHRCSNLLKHYILLKNCCDVLLMADKNKDEDLKNAVQDYIMQNDEKVFFSDDWKNLEKYHPQLTIEVLRAVCMKKRQ